MFRSPLLVPASESAFLNKESDTLLTRLLGEAIAANTPTLSLAGCGVDRFKLIGKNSVSLDFAASGHRNY